MLKFLFSSMFQIILIVINIAMFIFNVFTNNLIGLSFNVFLIGLLFINYCVITDLEKRNED
jgi:hypothetical protein